MKLQLILTLCWVSSSSCANILALYSMVSPSHHIWTTPLATALANRGHNVTVLSTLPIKEPTPNITNFVLEGVYDFAYQQEEYDLENMSEVAPSDLMTLIFEWLPKMCKFQLQTKGLKNLLDYPDDFKFDLIIFEPTSGECLLGMAKKFGSPPMVAVSGFSHPQWVNYMVGNPEYPSYIPNLMLDYPKEMTFFQRMNNFLFHLSVAHGWHANALPAVDNVARQYLGPSSAIPSEEIRRVSVVMVNTHPTFDTPRPLLPSMVNIAGIHIKEPKPLPKDLQEFLDTAKEGVVFFSLGSNLQSSKLKLEKREAILKAFSELPQKVLWKFEDDSLPGQPKNVKIGKWLPQSDILAHPNVRLFITHSGLLSTQESIHRSVPMVGIPFFADQKINIEKVKRLGVGVRLDYRDLTKESLLSAIRRVLDDASYAKNMKELSARYRDQPETPLDRAVYWCEYVIRHQGAHHLRSAAMDLTWYQYLLLDVIVFLGVVTVTPVVLVGLCCKKIFSRRQQQTKIKKN